MYGVGIICLASGDPAFNYTHYICKIVYRRRNNHTLIIRQYNGPIRPDIRYLTPHNGVFFVCDAVFK